MKQNRYPGVKPFERSEKAIFFGRSQDMGNLYELILLEKLSVLFGKSGYGKSSLLNAGILPRFEEAAPGSPGHYLPLSPRFGVYTGAQSSTTPVDLICQKLEEKWPAENQNNYLDTLVDQPTLWYHFKKRQTAGQNRFLLIFDQFEELFSYPPEQQEAFKLQLAELLYTAIPQPIRDAAEGLPDDQYQHLTERLEVKAVFAIRSDRLSFLDQLKDALPAILHKRYELRALRPEQAREAILEPARLKEKKGLSFHTPPFTYAPAALESILANLSGADASGQSGIEAFQLQIICQYVERVIREGLLKGQEDLIEVQPAQLPDLANIYEAYYQQQVRLLPETRRQAARLVIEEGLLLQEENGEVLRMSVDGRALIDRYKTQGVDEELLDTLVNGFLLRRERNTTGGFNYEISHDTLLKPIAHSRSERQAERERQENERRRQEAEAKAKEEAERRKEAERLQQAAERGRRRALIFSFVALALLLIATIAGLLAWKQSKIARNRLDEVLQAQAGEDRQKYNRLLERAQDLEELYPDAACELYREADSLREVHLGSNAFKGQAEVIGKKLENCK